MGNEYGFPNILYSLVGQRFVFIIDIHQQFNVERKKDNYTIIKMFSDSDLIEKYDTSNELMQVSFISTPIFSLFSNIKLIQYYIF